MSRIENIRRMKAAILVEQNKPLVVDVIDFPEKLETGQVLVRITHSTICGAQVNEITGRKGPDPYLPHLLGHEGVGYVEQIGPGVTHVRPDKRVVIHWRKGRGIEADFPKYDWKGVTVGAGKNTTFSEYSIVSENRLTEIPEDVPVEMACLFGCAVTTGFGIVENEARLRMGESILVIGCGGVGLSVIQGASLVSAHPIVAVDVIGWKLESAPFHGADHTVLVVNSSDMVASVREILPDGADVVVEMTGITHVIEQAYSCVAPGGGRLILVGQPEYGQELTFSNMVQHYCGKKILDSQGGLCDPSEAIPRYIGLARAGLLEFEGLVTHKFPLEEINQAVHVMVRGESIRCLLEM